MQHIRSIYIVRKLDDRENDRVEAVVNKITKIANLHDKKICEIDEVNYETFVIAVGGDGTMIEAMRIAHAKYAVAIGINLGKIGFLTDIANDENLENELSKIIGSYCYSGSTIEHRIALVAEHNNTTSIAFNEFVIANKYSDGLIQYHLYIDTIDAGVHKANALIVGTPTGSTAYTLSAGGGLILPTMGAMQVVPVAPLSMTSRPIIIPGVYPVTVDVETKGTWVLKRDGVTCCEGENTGTVIIGESAVRVTLCHPKEWNFFDMLTQKLGWKNR